LYEVDADGNWHPLFSLLNDVAAADPAMFVWEGRWWLAFTDADIGEMDNLCLYFADRLEGPWLPHANNPVKVDIAGARMAGGFFHHDGQLYRPAQDCLQTYGAGIVVYRVIELAPERFSEEPVRRLLPDVGSCCPHGLHTLNAWGERTLVDAKRHGVNPLVLWRNLRRRWERSPSGRLFSGPPVQSDISGPLFRVMVYVPHLRVGGGEISMLRLAEGFAADGLEVCLVANSAETVELAIPPGVTFVSLGGHGTLSALWSLSRLLREYRPHCLLSAFPHTNVAALVALALSGVNARCVVTEHAPLSRLIAQQDNWRYRLLPALLRWAYRRAHAVVGVSTGVRDDLQQILGKGVAPQVIRNPVLGLGFEAEMALAVGDPWLTDEALRVVLSVCRLSVEKDLPTLIKAFAEVHRERPETRLLMVGEGPDRGRLEKLIAEMGLGDVVRLPGYTGTPLAWMRRAAVFVLSSRFEGFGNALVEAMACGTPVVSTDCPVGPREILEGGRLGDLVPVGDAPAMARAIGDALDAPGRFPEAREAALRYTQAKSCASYRRLFESPYSSSALCGFLPLPF
jgi:glycosyltransferase involved in cell wall biosynthesis